MKTTRYLFITLLMTIWGMGAAAQQRNVLLVPDVTSQIGNVQLPVNIENTDEIVGAQFDLTLPTGVTAETTGTMTGRSEDHVVTISRLNNGAYRVLLHSAQNRPLRGQQGVVMYLPITIPTSFVEGSEHQMTLSNAVLGKASGENVLTEVIAGKIRISKLPDLTVKNISLDKQTLNPGERVAASWQVENIGEIATGGGWSEQLSLVSGDGKQSKYITTAHYEGTLDAGGIVSRQVEVTLPSLLGIDGQSRLQVKIVPDSNAGESVSAQGNNTQLSNSLININKILTLELSPRRIVENTGGRIALKVSRSGNWTAAETFAITATADSRVSVPTNITIPANQSGAVVYFNVTDNNALDNDSIVNIKVTGNNYPEASARLIIEDNEYPNLTLTASKSQITEGETFQLTVTASRISASPIEVTLTSENNKRFSFQPKVIIPAGETSAQVTVQTIDDELPSLDLSNAFTASAPNYNKSEAIVILMDNDLPVLELTLTPTTVSEGAGVVAVAGVLKRTTNTNSKITVKISDDADGGLYFGNRTLELAKGVEEVHFNFGPVDNALMDGDRTYTIAAAVWLSSCSCSASGESAGSVTAQLQVLDNDGAALNLTSSLSTVKEGGKTTLTVSRNTTDNSKPLTVTLQSDYDDNLTYNHTVTIPAGQKSATVEVTSKGNDIQGDSHIVIFTVQADAYATGTCYLMVTDQTLPDARISNITADVAEAEVGTRAILNIVVTNDGAAELSGEVPVKIYRRGDAEAVGTVYTSESIAVGDSQTLTKTITLPQAVGTHTYYAVVNESNRIQELTYNNNTSADVAITTISPFSVIVNTDKSIYKHGEKILITGQLTGNGTANTAVDIYLINEGARQVQSVTTDEQGAFSYEWQLYALQSGHFVVGACYPGEGLREEMASFDVYGLKRTENGYITCDVICGDTYQGYFNISNPGFLDLTGVKAEVVLAPDNCNASVSVPTTINGGQTVKLSYQLQGTEPTDGKDWEEVKVRITANEGATLDVTLYFYCRNARAKIMASTNNIVTTMTKGKTREYNLQVTNIGRGNTGKITLALPDFIKSLSGNTLPALDQNASIEIPLTFTSTDEMPLNIPVKGCFGINCENGDGVAVNYEITPVSESTGILIIDAVDAYTYQTVEAPHVSGAIVKIKAPRSHNLIIEGVTNEEGVYSVELPEGFYSIQIITNKHDLYERDVYIDPGKDNSIIAVLQYEPISINWNVTETEVDDKYSITTIIEYETNVPVPVVILDMPDKIDADLLAEGESLVFNAIITNKGLVAGKRTDLIIPEHPLFLLEPLSQSTDLVILPGQSINIPIRVTRLRVEEPRGARKIQIFGIEVNCGIVPETITYYDCGEDGQYYMCKKTLMFFECNITDHNQFPAPKVVRLPICPPPPIDAEIDIKEIEIIIDPPKIEYKGCEPCQNSKLIKFYELGLSFIPGLGLVVGAAECGGESYDGKKDARHYSNCAATGAGVAAAIGVKNVPVINILNFFYQYSEPCNVGNHKSSSLRKRISEISYLTEFEQKLQIPIREMEAYREYLIEYFGNSVWTDKVLIKEWQQLLQDVLLSEDDYFDASLLIQSKPTDVTDTEFISFIERLNNTTRVANGLSVVNDNYIHDEIVASCIQKMLECENLSHEMGNLTTEEMVETAFMSTFEKLQEQSSSVCATISLQLDQTMTLTRQAFRGTLTVFNGNEDIPMEDVKLTLNVINMATGQIATSHEFQINPESLNGFTGELDLGSGWTLGANDTGTATILFIPTKYAAPTGPVEWSFGGTLTYIDPFTGLEVTRDLFPVTLTVKPTPELDLTYFMQRDVYGDDPLTEEVEPMVPAEFSLLINNVGNGDATNVKMVTQQPEIIDNEKGLAINFDIQRSQLNGGEETLALSSTVPTNFGTIPAHSQAYAQWWLTSSLLGHFTDYDVQATHVTSYDNPDLSLLNEVTIHELIHSIKVDDGKVTGFVVNDFVDAEDTPDMVYFTDGTTTEVSVATNAVMERRSNTEYLLTIMPSQTGWNYGHITDPTHGHANLVGIRRQSDGKEINPLNFWQTDRTLLDGRDWLYENNLHFVDQMAGSTETYALTFELRPDVELQVASFCGIPEEGTVLRESLQTVTVTFNKAIDATTFTREDITLNCQGRRLEGPIAITPVSDTQFMLDLSQLTTGNGYYVLTIQTAGITDFEGFNGADGKMATWIQFNSLGDLNYDYKVDISDAVIVLNIMAAGVYNETADVNHDGKVDIADFVTILNIMAAN